MTLLTKRDTIKSQKQRRTGNIRKVIINGNVRTSASRSGLIAIAHLSDSVKRKVKPEGFCSEINVVTRAGMKEILSRSSKPEAKALKEQIFGVDKPDYPKMEVFKSPDFGNVRSTMINNEPRHSAQVQRKLDHY